MNTESGFRFGIIKTIQTDENEKKKTLQRGLIKSERYECEYCFKELSKINYSHHLKRCSIYKKKLEQEGKDVVLYASGNKKIPSFTKKIELDPDGNKQIEIVPSNKNRDIVVAIGTSGAGKSYFINEFLKKWKQEKGKGKDIYFFSALLEDPSITEKVNRVDLQKFYEEQDLYMEDFKDCCIVADDIDCISDTKIRKKLYNFINYMLYTGRHINCSLVITLHAGTTKNGETKCILNESTVITIFINNIGVKGMNYVLQAYLGLSNKQIQRLRKLGENSRWISIIKSCPNVICSQYSCYANYASDITDDD